MKIRIALAVLVVLALAATTAYAATERVSESNFAANGWTRTIVNGGLQSGAACGFRSDSNTVPAYVEGLHPSPKSSDSTHLSWAGLGKNIVANGTKLSTVTYLRIRTAGWEGDGASWEAPSICLNTYKDAGLNPRVIRFLPYRSYGGRPTSPDATPDFVEYDAMSASAQWYNQGDGSIKTGWANVLAINAGMNFYSNPAGTVLPGNMQLNAFSGALQSNDVPFASSARGTIDWIDIGFAGVGTTRYDFVIPEPGSLLALATGLIGFLGLRKRR